MDNKEFKTLMNSLRDLLNCNNPKKLSRNAANDLFDNLMELDEAMDHSGLANINNMDLMETFKLLDECVEVKTSVQPLICAIRNGMREYLESRGLLGIRGSHENTSYELSRQNSMMRNISKSIVDKPKMEKYEELSVSREKNLDRVVDLLIINSYRKKLSR
jgi:hypothetical protein